MNFPEYLRRGGLWLAGLLLALPLRAQTPTPCGTETALRRALGAGYDAWWAGYRARVRAHDQQRRTQPRRAATVGPQLVIPVVVHVIHDGVAGNITDAQIHDQIRILNEDFQKRNVDTASVIPPFQSRIGNANVVFRLARLDPQGNCTNGITRTYSTLTNNADDNVKQLVSWDGEKYLNVWLVNNISFGAAGYAYLPCWVGPDIDGIVILHAYFGSIGTGSPRTSRAFTHEVGHYLGLPHTWGGTNSPGPGMGNCADDDGVFDTPNTEGSSPGVCDVRQPSCPGDPDPLSNVQNYMDYSYCSAMFTAGQAELMNDGLANGTFGSCHATLTTPANLLATGVADGQVVPPCFPTVAFGPAAGISPFAVVRICAGDSVRFRAQVGNLQPGDSVRYQWVFPGGTPDTSNAASPVVHYPAEGQWDVWLAVHTAGGTGLASRSGYVQAINGGGGLATPAISSFEPSPNPGGPMWIWPVETNQGISWDATTDAAAQGATSMRVVLRNSGEGSEHRLISPPVTISQSLNQAWLRMRVAYAQRSSSNRDVLKVALSRDCGRTWTTRLTRSGTTLAAGNAPRPALFVPAAGEWHDFSMPVGRVLAGEEMMFRFSVFGDNGNALYLDDLRLDGPPLLGVATDAVSSTSLTITPNPSDGQAELRVVLPPGTRGTLRLLDALGRRLGQAVPVGSGDQTIGLRELAGRPAAGLYLVELTSADGRRLTRRVLVY